MKIVISISIIALLISNCSRKTDLDNQITITINSVDSKTKLPRINTFDDVEVRKEGIGYLMKTFKRVGKYKTDSTGSVKVKIDTTKIYDISVLAENALGGDMYYPGYLKDGQKVIIEVVSLENK
ncbi:hypothetical protein [Flavobacterium sp. 5]|uniref:hypothetical protein n=1 Tax=Flavobacterium sp. 5 TaxID=2035199 RepID=UPI0012FDDB17|nr:hypothetical protein [Flavobacterium sp. 5]